MAGAKFKQQIAEKAAALGFDAVGFTQAKVPEACGEGLREYLAAGRHGEMAWMEARADQRADPQVLWPEAVSVISLGMSYAPEGDALASVGMAGVGNISVYARGRDYHDVIKGKLKHLAQFIASVRGGRESICGYRAGDGKTAGLACGCGLAGQAYESRVAQAWLLVVSGRGVYNAADCARYAACGSVRALLGLHGGVPDGCVSRTL